VHSESAVTWTANACTVAPTIFLWSTGMVDVEEWSRKDGNGHCQTRRKSSLEARAKEQNSELTGIELTDRHHQSDLRPSSRVPLGFKPRRFRISNQNCWAANQSVVSRGSKVSLIKDKSLIKDIR
jgi:hypothetical protein